MHNHTAGSVIALCAVLLAGTAACSSSDGDSKTATGKPVSGGTLTYALTQEPDCLDPAVSPMQATAIVNRNIFDSLVSLDSDGKFHPALAEKWAVSPDGTTYTFTLKKGVVFHDGTPFDATAVKATLDHVVDPKTKSYYAASLISVYRGAKVVDASTVEVKIAAPTAPFLQALSTAYLGIQSPKALTRDAAQQCQSPVGTGPFQVSAWEKKSSIKLTRNPAYAWAPPTAGHTGPALLDGLTFQFIPENSARLGALTSGQVNGVDGVQPADVAQVKGSGSLQLLRADSPGTAYSLYLNAKKAPFSDEKVRIAFQRSLNLDVLIKSVYFGQYARAWSPLSPTTLGYDPSTVGTWAYDPTLSNKLLDEAGWATRDSEGYRTKDGKRLSLYWPYTPLFATDSRTILGQGIQADAKKVGIDLKYTSVDVGQLQKDVLTGASDLYSTSYVRAEPDILRFFFASDQTADKGGGNAFHFSAPDVDGWLKAATGSSDDAVRKTNYANVQKYVLEHALVVPTYVPSYLAGVSKKVHDVKFDPSAYPVFYDAWLEH
ncbi:ABC transporter substrate-binding protein [Actinocorallia sp. API 0066]|uniref:ABC transporter substrate-binding protein n=1 Tax=Actinocorallia sp. API 0066 TaxID=2896846 RepID=UPI001E529453|nr:ABC transporter substrate-binding protein [Actinocorallia sp. API 0066]MCD0451740.1 ABC transporter substrate-binding protein [Actinocorallia sp. API 0066]